MHWTHTHEFEAVVISNSILLPSFSCLKLQTLTLFKFLPSSFAASRFCATLFDSVREDMCSIMTEKGYDLLFAGFFLGSSLAIW